MLGSASAVGTLFQVRFGIIALEPGGSLTTVEFVMIERANLVTTLSAARSYLP